jgi:hypothetical protein
MFLAAMSGMIRAEPLKIIFNPDKQADHPQARQGSLHPNQDSKSTLMTLCSTGQP